MSQMDNGGDRPQDSTVVEQAQEKVQEKAQEARGAALRVVRDQVDARSAQVGEQLTDVVEGFRRTGQTFRSEGKEGPAKVLDTTADRAERVAQYLSSSSSNVLLHDAEDFGRRNPWLVIAGGVALGLVASRLLKASSTRRFEEIRSQGYTSSRPPQRQLPPARVAQPPAPTPAGSGAAR
jgi:ElaB/YqjD/DUF883 family membrane-anchored ribosome-binding protein